MMLGIRYTYIQALAMLVLLLGATPFYSHVKPGINDSFRDPDLKEFQGKFVVYDITVKNVTLFSLG